MGALGVDKNENRNKQNQRQNDVDGTENEHIGPALDGEILDPEDSPQENVRDVPQDDVEDTQPSKKKMLVGGGILVLGMLLIGQSFFGDDTPPAPQSVEDKAVQAVEGNRPLAGIQQGLGQAQITDRSIIDEFSSNTKDVVVRLRDYREQTGAIPSYQTPPAWAYKDWNPYEAAPSTARVKIFEGEIYYDDIEAAPIIDGIPDEASRVVQDTFTDPADETKEVQPADRGVVGQIADSLRGSTDQVMENNPLGSKLDLFKKGASLLGGI